MSNTGSFLNEVVNAADCGILLDVNNIYVSSQNHGFDAMQYVNSVEVERVAQKAITLLGEAGVSFVEVDAGAYIQEAGTVFWTLLNVGMRDDLRNYFQRHNMKLQSEAVIEAIASKDTRRLFALASEADVPAELMVEARGAVRTRIAQIYQAMFHSYGISAIAFPTEPLVAPFIKAGGDEFEDQVEWFARIAL